MCHHCGVNWTAISAIGAIISALGTLFVVYLAYSQLTKFNNTTKADFAHRIKSDFFTKKTRNLFRLFDYEVIDFIPNEIKNEAGETDGFFPYFEVNTEELMDINSKIKCKKTMYLSDEIDDLLLGHFEDIGIFRDKGVLDDFYVREEFEYYISKIGSNSAIRQYIEHIRRKEKEKENEIYDKFEKLFLKIDPTHMRFFRYGLDK